MNDKAISQPHLHIIWDSDGSLDGVIGLLYFLQHPNVSVYALAVSCTKLTQTSTLPTFHECWPG
jgi:inosine-uridine nucleoside N-ribohydrolase